VANAAPFVSVDLAAVTREVLSDLEVQISETGAIVDVGDLPTIQADPLQMRQLLQNLIGNSLKFHKKGTSPTIRVRTEDVEASEGAERLLRLLVEDDGIGFDEKYLDRIFTVFQRLHGRAEYQGTGVGLAICRKIAQRHGGRITATSAPDQGAIFVVVLPRTHAFGDGVGPYTRPH
jgi:light-regulated signal transduction histidine kinase (bacteriophytochrome)